MQVKFYDKSDNSMDILFVIRFYFINLLITNKG
jgi:hypothetical protein